MMNAVYNNANELLRKLDHEGLTWFALSRVSYVSTFVLQQSWVYWQNLFSSENRTLTSLPRSDKYTY